MAKGRNHRHWTETELRDAERLRILWEDLTKQFGATAKEGVTNEVVQKIARAAGLTYGQIRQLGGMRNDTAHAALVTHSDIIKTLRVVEFIIGQIRGTGPHVAVGVPGHHLECFQLIDNGDTLRHRWFDNGWSHWHELHSNYPKPAIDLTAASAGKTLIEVFVLANDERVWHLKWRLGEHWHGWHHEWEPFEDVVEGPIAAASIEAGHFEVYAFRNGSPVSRWRRPGAQDDEVGYWGDEWETPWVGTEYAEQ